MGVCSGLIVVALTIRLIFGKYSLCNYNSGSFSDGIREFISDYKEMPIKDLLLKNYCNCSGAFNCTVRFVVDTFIHGYCCE